MLHFIVNPASSSGNAAHMWTLISKKLAKKNVSYNAHLTTGTFAATKFAREICQMDDDPTIIVIGGDGTVNEVLTGIDDFDKVTFGYIPAGSSNDLARDLGLTTDPEAALSAILNPTEYINLDVGRIVAGEDVRNFAVSAGIGYDASICHEALHSNIKSFLNKIHLGKLTYVIIALKQLAKAPRHACTICLDDNEPISFSNYLFTAVMIHRYEGGGFMFCPEAKYDDGILDVCAVHNIFKLKVLRMLPTAYNGEHTKFKGIDIYKCRKITITSEKPAPIHTDGESCGVHSEVTMYLNAAKLKMIYKASCP